MESYAGTYQDSKIIDRKGKLYYLKNGRSEMLLEPISANTFVCKEVEFIRFQFKTNSQGKVIGLIEWYYEDGHKEYFEKH